MQTSNTSWEVLVRMVMPGRVAVIFRGAAKGGKDKAWGREPPFFLTAKAQSKETARRKGLAVLA